MGCLNCCCLGSFRYLTVLIGAHYTYIRAFTERRLAFMRLFSARWFQFDLR